MTTPRPPFRADHVGSLLRPAYLSEAREQLAAGTIDAADFDEVADRAVLEIIRLQEDVGLIGITDGEARRDTWHMDYIYQIGGITKRDSDMKVRFHNEGGDIEWTPAKLAVVDKLNLPSTIFADAFTFLKDNVRRGVPKLTIPSPSMVHYRGGREAVSAEVYPDLSAFYADLSSVYAREIAGLGALGCTYLQLDDTSLAYLNDPAQRAMIAAQGEDADTQHETYIRIINDAVKDRPAGMTITTHLCRGNFRSSWVASGSYDHVADALFNTLDVDGYFLEFDDERSGGFEPLRLLPKGHKRVVLGLVTTKHGELEDPDTIKRRIDAAAKFAPMEQLCLSAQCGFSSTKEGNDVTPDQQRAKLEMIVEIAQDMWGEL
ncbi:5-methyltetrahydropteroyltriglutamate--homocysteine S-methyltransferase [Sphingomonas spermidinifaciens]|uniref:5-methyltetrahydropteroyltriglutamate--homocysteine S-methyltransferase n=1 Tax=Sphingomonas spermidinifaciens TaxID=1141889 RepID=A0A2A4B904_9SPHN|nr:5-methyltetrahydropteroyltriglutamate--homocysteine S-methyltransferase [Sphingomonas spermidinifaciens]PCD04550.1 5-methyltetrahydropteroyltriglutamate--homocysteine S-methyltransferase [Sphingomonas spermidinifaciens]